MLSHKPHLKRNLTPSTPVAVQEEEVVEVKQQQEPDKDTLAQGESAWREVKKRIKFYLEPILEAFGDHRLIYASGFPCM
jgi:predicted TIM-barrel fold metal-dependent hydrolase